MLVQTILSLVGPKLRLRFSSSAGAVANDAAMQCPKANWTMCHSRRFCNILSRAHSWPHQYAISYKATWLLLGNPETVRKIGSLAKRASGGQPPDARDLSLWYQSRGSLSTSETGCPGRHPASVLVPGSALGLLPSMALSFAQAGTIIAKGAAPEKELMEPNRCATAAARLRRSPPRRA